VYDVEKKRIIYQKNPEKKISYKYIWRSAALLSQVSNSKLLLNGLARIDILLKLLLNMCEHVC
jgi:hypothetical protein